MNLRQKKRGPEVNRSHKWKTGERVVSTSHKNKFYGKPGRIIKRAFFSDTTGEYCYSVETEEGGEIFCIPSSSIESLEERPEEGYKPANNRILREQFPGLIRNEETTIQETEVKHPEETERKPMRTIETSDKKNNLDETKNNGIEFIRELRNEADRARGKSRGIRAAAENMTSKKAPVNSEGIAFIKDLRKDSERHTVNISDIVTESNKVTDTDVIKALRTGAEQDPGEAGRERIEQIGILIAKEAEEKKTRPEGRDIDGAFDRYNAKMAALRELRK